MLDEIACGWLFGRNWLLALCVLLHVGVLAFMRCAVGGLAVGCWLLGVCCRIFWRVWCGLECWICLASTFWRDSRSASESQ